MSALLSLWRILSGIVREIADEDAYRRYLAARNLEHSGAEWRRFHDARLRRKYQRAKCC